MLNTSDMEILFLFKGIFFGFCIAAPVGPVGLVCIRKTLQYGRLSGFCSGLGAALADMFYGILAAFGFTLVSDFLGAHRFWFSVFSLILLVSLGIKTFFSKPKGLKGVVCHRTCLRDMISTFFLTLSNPLTLLAFIAVFAGIDLSQSRESAPLVIFGIFVGATLWWMLLSEGVTLFRHKIDEQTMLWINRVAGIALVCFGIALFTVIH